MRQVLEITVRDRTGARLAIYEDPNFWEWRPNYCSSSSKGSSISKCNGCKNVLEHILNSSDAYKAHCNYTPSFHLHPDSVKLLVQEVMGMANRKVAVSKDGVICKKCMMKNEYGENNQKDGTYVCYMCR